MAEIKCLNCGSEDLIEQMIDFQAKAAKKWGYGYHKFVIYICNNCGFTQFYRFERNNKGDIKPL